MSDDEEEPEVVEEGMEIPTFESDPDSDDWTEDGRSPLKAATAVPDSAVAASAAPAILAASSLDSMRRFLSGSKLVIDPCTMAALKLETMLAWLASSASVAGDLAAFISSAICLAGPESWDGSSFPFSRSSNCSGLMGPSFMSIW
jgi:hypothetical protein